jgi:hypothetical protein
MRKRLVTAAVVVFAAIAGFTTPVLAEDTLVAAMRALEEVPAVISPGAGLFVGSLNGAETQIDYTLVYFGTTSNVTQAHIHVGQKSVNGGIVLFLCANNPPITPPGTVPAPPPCPNLPGINVVTGTLSATNIVAVAAQGVAALDFSGVVDAIKGLASYVNVHTVNFPSGEIRGQVGH